MTLVSLFFVYMIPIDCKINNFSLYLLVYFLKDYRIYFLVRAQLLISGKPVSQYASYSLIFSPLCSFINVEQHKKYLYTINPAITENTECSIVTARTSFIDLEWVYRCITSFVLLLAVRTCWTAKNNARSTPAGSSCAEAIRHVLQIVTYTLRDKGMEYKGEQR